MKSVADHYGARRTAHLFTLTATAFLAWSTVTQGADPQYSRVIAGLGSAQVLLDDLEFMVVDLAGRTESFENNIFPNIDIFLIGVNTDLPVRFDLIFSEEFGQETQAIVPVGNLQDFLKDNLDPIDIVAKRDTGGDRDLYQLTGNVYEGWLRSLKSPDYTVIFPRKEWIPKGMTHPATMHKALVEAGFCLFAHLNNDMATMESRTKAFEAMRTKAVDSIQKRSDESRISHDLRQTLVDEQLALFQQWFVECAGFTVGTNMNRDTSILTLSTKLSAIPDTALSANIDRIKKEASYFAAIEQPENAILTARIHMANDDRSAQGQQKVYTQALPVVDEYIDEDTEASDSEKVARKEASRLLNDVLMKSTELKMLDAMMDVIPSGDHHVMVLAIRCAGRDSVEAIFDKLPQAIDGWSIEKNVGDVDGTKISRVGLGKNVPQALIDLYGPSVSSVYVAANDNAFWIALGDNALVTLSDRIKTAQTATNVQSNGDVLSVRAKAAPIAASLNGLLTDETSVFHSMFTQQQQRVEDRTSNNDEEETRTGRQAASAFLTFEWLGKVAEAMKGEDDTLTMDLKYAGDNTLTGTTEAHRGILKAIGTMIANFADENLQ